MAIFELPEEWEIDYSPNGDDIDSFSQKVKNSIEAIFVSLQALRTNNAVEGLDDEGALAYQWRTNTKDGSIWIRNADNTDWVYIGTVDKYLGATPETINAIRNGGGFGQFKCGKFEDRPATAETNDFYFAYDSFKVYRWDGSKWVIFLSLNMADIKDYEKYCISRGELTQQGGTDNKGKILQLDGTTGKANVDITGSAARISDFEIDIQNLRDDHVLTFDALKSSGDVVQGKFVNKPRLPFPCDIDNLEDGQILVYHSSTGNFQNEGKEAIGAGKSLILRDGGKLVGDYNGSATTTIDLQDIINQASFGQDLEHLTRLVENLYLALDVSKLNPEGYDGLSSETFRGDGNDIDTTEIDLVSVGQGSDSLSANTIEGLIEGANYILKNGSTTEDVQIKNLTVNNGVGRITLTKPVEGAFASGTKLIRTSGTVTEGRIGTTGTAAVSYITNPITFVNEKTGDTNPVSRVHLSVKHDNVIFPDITASIALRNAVYVSDEIIGIGNGAKQTVTLENTTSLTHYKFEVYFNGVLQTSGIEFNPTTGRVTFNAANDVIVTAKYFYNWGTEEFVALEKVGTYPDRKNPGRATTQFTYSGEAGTVATLKLSLIRGLVKSEKITLTGTGAPQGVKLKGVIVNSLITVKPSTATYSYVSAQKALILTAPAGEAVTITYTWRDDAFGVDSFACVFNE